MKRYRIIKKILISFNLYQEQVDEIVGPENDVVLESDGRTIWAIAKDGKIYESITTANAIELWLKEGSIEEIVQKEGL